MATMQYIGFDVSNKQRVSLGGGDPIITKKLKLFNKTNYTFRIVLWENFDEIYSTSNTNFKIKIREKRQATTNLILVDTSSFLSSLWTTDDQISLIYVYDLEGGKFKAGDSIYGEVLGNRGKVIDFNEENGYLIYKPDVSGQYFDYQEVIRVSYGEEGTTGVKARLGLEEMLLSYNVGEGVIACTCLLDDAALDTYMVGKESADLILELTEIDGGSNATVLGQCEIKIVNSFS